MSETRFSLARVVLLTVGTLIPLPRLAAQSEGSSPMGARIDEYLQRAGAFGFAGVVLVSVDGKVVLQKGYGRIGVSGAAPLDAATVLPIASLTKQFTATAILRLEMQGRLSTSDSISDHFADVPEDKKTITIHQLLTHTSGIVSELPDTGSRPHRDEGVKEILGRRLEFPPGTDTMYSNCGFSLLAAIVETIGGKDFATYLEDEFFGPLGMENTGMWPYGEAIVPGLERSPVSWFIMGAGGIASTVGDLHRWLDALQGDRVLSEAAKQELYTPWAGNYAYGWRVADSRVFGKVIWHDGDRAGVSTTIRRYEDHGVTLIYFDTAGFRPAIMNKILLIPLGHEVSLPPALDRSVGPDVAKQHEGVYESPGGGEIVIRAEGRQLWIGGRGQRIVDALGSASEENQREARDVTASTAEIVADLAQGDFTSVGDAFTNRIPDADVEDAVRADWELFERTHGLFESSEILGTSRSNRSTLLTFVRLRFERGMEIYRFEWDNGVVMGINETAKLARGLDSYPGDRAYLPETRDSYVVFDFSSESTTRIVFRRDGSGATMVLEGSGDPIEAIRKKE